MELIDKTGRRYGKLVVLRRVDNKHGQVCWLCRCDCGNEVIVKSMDLQTGGMHQCRTCVAKSQRRRFNNRSSEFIAWRNMIKRCTDESDHRYADYGARGIKVCERWSGKDGFEHFIEDMGPKPSEELSLDRIDVDGNYEPGNCRWTTVHVQTMNRRSTRFLEYDGTCMPISHWEREFGLKQGIVHERLERGISLKTALTRVPRGEKIINVNEPPPRYGLDHFASELTSSSHEGEVYGDLTVVSGLSPLACGHERVVARCKCGAHIAVHLQQLTEGYTVGCGCSPMAMKRRNVVKNPHALIDLTGQMFGRLTVLGRDDSRTTRGTYWLCRCECGKLKSVNAQSLRSGQTVSCGCLRRERTSELKRKHGMSGTITYQSFDAMHVRCRGNASRKFDNYAARGIKVCERWSGEDGFKHFLEDMGERPNRRYSLDRIDVDGDYEPGNCRWATDETQANNRRACRQVEYGGRTMTMSQWARRFKMSYSTFRDQLVNHGLSMAEIERLAKERNDRKVASSGSRRLLERHTSRKISYLGVDLICAEWARVLGITPSLLSNRVNRQGLPLDKVLCPGRLRDYPTVENRRAATAEALRRAGYAPTVTE